jgi:hypothetical protein
VRVQLQKVKIVMGEEVDFVVSRRKKLNRDFIAYDQDYDISI